MPLIWKGMRIEGDRPEVGRGANLLGVRVGDGKDDDINPDANGFVHPGQGGMSVSRTIDTLPPHRIPRRLRQAFPQRFPDASGVNRLHCWSFGEGPFEVGKIAERLRLRPDPDDPGSHGFVEPDDTMQLADYENALAATRDQWRRWEER
jgi:hypothetical protein